MTISVKNEGNKAVFVLEGRLDTVTAPELDEKVNALSGDVTELTMDMAKVEYVSSAGLRVLLSAQKKMMKVGKMTLVSVGEAVMEVFEITGFADILSIA